MTEKITDGGIEDRSVKVDVSENKKKPWYSRIWPDPIVELK